MTDLLARSASPTGAEADAADAKAGPSFFSALRVIEIGSWIAAPCATALLADLGADVIKVEPPTGDPGRAFVRAAGGGVEMAPAFALFNRTKRGIVLDISTPEDRERLDTLLASADVLVTNLRAGALDRAGLSPDKVCARFPRLVYASITGFGLKGEERDRASYDVGAFWARTGLLHRLTPPGLPPTNPAGGYGDVVVALATFGAIVAALLERTSSGRGQLVESSLLQSGAWVTAGDLGVQAALGRISGTTDRSESRTPMANCYRTADERWIFLLGVEARRHFPAICRAIGREDLIDDARFATAAGIRQHRRELIPILDEAFASKPLAEWPERLDAAGVWWQAVAAPADVLTDRQLWANEVFRNVPVGHDVPMVTAPFTLSGCAAAPLTAAPALGQHTDEIINDLVRAAGEISADASAEEGTST